jgi:hypothetical protein
MVMPRLLEKVLPITQKIFKTKAIRTPEIVKNFLENKKVDSPEEYLRQICYESSGFLPAYYYLRQANLNRSSAIKLLQKVQSTSPAKNKLIERLGGEDNLTLPVPTSKRSAGKAKLKYREQLEAKSIEIEAINDEKEIRYLLQAIRTLDSTKARSKYVKELLLRLFDAHYGVTGLLAGEIRAAICFVDHLTITSCGHSENKSMGQFETPKHN